MRTILLVDDSPVARHVLSRRLAELGFSVHEAESAAAARVADAGGLFCAIMDLELDDGDGADLAATLLRERASLPVAFFTAGASPQLLDRARAQGPVFDKPNVDGVVAWALQAGQPPPTK